MSQTQASLDAEINSFLVSGSDITAAALRQVLHDMNAGIFQNGITGFGPPVNLVGLTPQQGQLSTALQSDTTLAINQAIVPTWTGVHTFANLSAASSPFTGAVIVSGGVGIAQALYVGQTIYAGSSTIFAPVEVGQRASGTVSGTVSSTSLTFTLEPGAAIVGIDVFTTTAFLASGSVGLVAGSAAGDNGYAQIQSIKGTGKISLTFNGSNAQNAGNLPSGSPNLWLTITQGGTPSAVGQCLVLVRYLLL